jgi:hypothetical protein
MTSNSVESDAKPVSSADKAAAANRITSANPNGNLIHVLAALHLLCRRVGTRAKAILDLARRCQFDLGEAGSLGPYGVSEPYLWLIGSHHDALISTVKCGWVHGREVFCDYAEALMARGETLPHWLVEFLVWGTRDGAKARREGCRRSSRGYDNVERDQVIAHTVRYIVDVTGLRPTRSQALRDKGGNESGCSIVARALGLVGVNLSEKGVEKVWSERKETTASGLAPITRRFLRDHPGRHSA